MKAVYTIAENITSPLGTTTAENFSMLKDDRTGISKHDADGFSPVPFHASLFEDNQGIFGHHVPEGFSKFEKLLISSISDALAQANIDVTAGKTIFIISSTKGNISYIEAEGGEYDTPGEISLYQSAKRVSGFFRNPNQPLVVSNACISGVLALLTAKRLINAGIYDTAIVAGADVITKFILSGFQSFQAVSPEPCKPFDIHRQGVTLGEGAGTMIISSDPSRGVAPVKIMGGATSNDANHISGPSRTGEPLFRAIGSGMREAGIDASEIDFIVAHGTATLYNDEMEAKAISLAGLQTVPVNSLKGYYGHTLGAAGLIESIIAVQCIRENMLIPTKGFEQHGVSEDINICSKLGGKQVDYVLKTASGFGGCNAAMIFGKQ